jgi:hypothetical protein
MYIYSFFLQTQLSPSQSTSRLVGAPPPFSSDDLVGASPPPFPARWRGRRPVLLPSRTVAQPGHGRFPSPHNGAHPPPIPARRHGRRPAASLPHATGRFPLPAGGAAVQKRWHDRRALTGPCRTACLAIYSSMHICADFKFLVLPY